MTQVVIGDILPYTQAVATSGQVVFSTNWTANYASDVVVYQTPVGDPANDVTQILAYPADYSVAFIGDQQEVQVTLTSGASAGDIITITRQTPADRLNLYSNTNFTPCMLNNDFGILTLVDQQAQLVDQKIAPRYNYSTVLVDVVDTILPLLGPNQFWSKNSSNTAIIAVNASDIIGGLTEVDTGLGLTGGPITSTGTISFGQMNANTFWGNVTGSTALPTMVSTGYFLQSANNLSDLTDTAAARTNIGLAIGTNVEAWSAALDSIAALTTSANEMLYLTGSNTYSVIAAAANSVLITSSGSVPSFSNSLPSAVQTNITKLGTQTQALNMNSHQINNVTDPTNPQDAATMAYVTAQTTGTFLPLIGGTMSGAINMGNHKITSLTDPSSAQDAVTLNYLNSSIANYLALSGGTMSGAINMSSNKITSLLDPTNPQDAATKNYVDLVASGLTVQPACYAASTGALTVTYNNGSSGIGATLTNATTQAVFSLDGTSPTVNSRVLIWEQASALQNGIYTVTNVGSIISNWVLTRATDYDQPAEIQPGDLVIINNGSLYAGTSFIETANVAAVGTDAIQFSQFTFSASSVLLKANNLSDVANSTTSFNNISPLTTKGDLIGYSTQNVRLAVGASNNQILQVNSSAATGLAWSTATYPATTTANQLLYSSSTNTVVGLSSAVGGVLVTDASSVPQFLANPSASGKILQSANGAIPAWSTPTYPSTSGTSGQLIISDGTNNIYSTPTFPNSSATSGKIIVSDGTNWIASTPTFPNASATSGKMIVSNGTNWIASTPTFPNASATSGKIIISDGTNWIASTPTYANPGSSGNVLTSDGTNWISATPVGTGTVNSGTGNQLSYYATTGTAVSGLATANSGLLTTDGSGVPSITLLSGLGILASLVKTVKSQVFTGSGTYTPSTGMLYCIIECLGGGGGGAGATTTSGSGVGYGTGGGGAGAYSKSVITAATIGGSQTVTIGTAGTGTSGNSAGGNGGATSVGIIVTANGGTGGSASSSSNAPGLGGSGGTAGTGNVAAPGACGQIGTGANGVANIYINSGQGANSQYGQGGKSAYCGGGTNTAGNAGTGYGSGGSGACTLNASGSVSGGDGTAGLVIITEFCNQ